MSRAKVRTRSELVIRFRVATAFVFGRLRPIGSLDYGFWTFALVFSANF